MFKPEKVGLSDVDPRTTSIEDGVKLFSANDRANWVYYDIALECFLDPGIVVHRRLPQVDNEADTLATCNIADPNIDVLTGKGVNLVSKDNYTDIVQRMAHSVYRFNLKGQAMRIGEQIPIPRLKKIAGIDAISYKTEWAYNKIVGNYSGQVLWMAEWSLWYTLASAPKKQQDPPQNLGLHIDTTSRDAEMQAPYSQPDDNAVSTQPPVLRNPIQG